MLKHLSIKSVAVIEELNIDFNEGLSVLSGETGAGKSIIIDSINLLKGERASKSIIRTGETKARVSGVFETDSLTAAKIADIIGSEPDSEIIISRELSLDGKNTIRINGMPVNLTMLKLVGDLLVNIHGQHDNASLLSVKRHIAFLDSFGGEEIAPALLEYKELFDKCKKLNEEIASIDSDETQKQDRIDMLSFRIAELEEANLEIGEDERLFAEKNMIDNAAKIKDNSHRAYQLLYGSEERSCHDILWEAINSLEKIADFDEGIGSVYNELSSIADSMDENIRDLRHICDNLSFDEERADYIEERLETIQVLKRKYGDSIEEILDYLDKAKTELSIIETGSERLEELKALLAEAKSELSLKAETLSKLRVKYSEILKASIESELKDLNMEKVEFSIELNSTDSYKSNGTQTAEFMVRTNVGEQMAPLAKIASGGELSRIMLAIKSVLNKIDSVKTSVFDEIDTGVSGAAAEKIGEKLHKMADGSLVLCITHLPQIAAMADNHYLIEKTVTDGRTMTKVRRLSGEERVDEIARVLGGSTLTEAARENARELLAKK